MAELDDSIVVEALTWTLYVGALSLPVAAALAFDVEPLATIQGWLPGWGGTAAAMAAGVGFLLGVRAIVDRVRAKPPAPPPPAAPAPERRRSKKKKKRSR